MFADPSHSAAMDAAGGCNCVVDGSITLNIVERLHAASLTLIHGTMLVSGLMIICSDAECTALYSFCTGSTRTNRTVPYTVLISRT